MAKMPSRAASPDLSLGFLRRVTDLLGAACFFNAAWEGLSQGRWHSFTHIYQGYYLFLSVYAGAREAQKWTAKTAPKERLTGEIFVGAWGALYAFLWAWDLFVHPVCWPPAMDLTLRWVLLVWGGSFASKSLRLSGLLGDFGQAGDLGGTGDAGGSGLPQPDSGGSDNPDAPDPSLPAPGGPVSGGSDTETLVMEACRQAGKFKSRDIAQSLNLSPVQVGGAIGRLMEKGLIRKGADGYFYWNGAPEQSN